jgi:putative colanic acid biosynthesis acetyltransferase WcaF
MPVTPALPITTGNRIARGLWMLTWAVLFRWSPRPCHGWRRLLLRAWGARIGPGAHVYPGARIWAPWNLVLGEGACIADGVDCYSQDRISLGRRAVVSQRAFLCCGTHDHTDPGRRLMTGPIRIGDEAWVCAQALIGPGVTVGDGCVVGAGAVAMRDQPAWMVCAGNPCAPIKPRILRGRESGT